MIVFPYLCTVRVIDAHCKATRPLLTLGKSLSIVLLTAVLN